MDTIDAKIRNIREICKKLESLEQCISQIDILDSVLKLEYENAILDLSEQLRDLVV